MHGAVFIMPTLPDSIRSGVESADTQEQVDSILGRTAADCADYDGDNMMATILTICEDNKQNWCSHIQVALRSAGSFTECLSSASQCSLHLLQQKMSCFQCKRPRHRAAEGIKGSHMCMSWPWSSHRPICCHIMPAAPSRRAAAAPSRRAAAAPSRRAAKRRRLDSKEDAGYSDEDAGVTQRGRECSSG